MERQRLDLNQTAFAALAGVTKTSQVSYESGTSYPNSQYFVNLWEAGINIHKLLTGTDASIDNWNLVDTIFLHIEECSQQSNISMTALDRSALFRILYESSKSTGSINKTISKSAFRLIENSNRK